MTSELTPCLSDEQWDRIRTIFERTPKTETRGRPGYAPIANRQGLHLFVVVDRHCPEKLLLDPIRVGQILNNLLGNALKFTYSGKVVVRACWLDGALVLSVADSGMGIPDELKQRLFQPFTQGNAHRLTQARGTGLGLSICSRLAQLMHGQIALDSTEGVGTRITVTLPLRTEGTDGPEKHEAALVGETNLLTGRCKIFCRAMEYREWFDSLFDPKADAPIYFRDGEHDGADSGYDYVLVTDEFSREPHYLDGIERTKIIWVTQDGPLVPTAREDGSVELSVFSLNGLRAAIGMVREGSHHDGHWELEGATADVHARTWAMPEARALDVLIAEDNLINRGLLRDQLRTLGANVIEASDGEEALRAIERTRIDVILTDIDMPKMTGNELLAEIRARHFQMPVYAVSASAGEEAVERGRETGFTDYLTKPLALSVLANALANVLADVLARRSASADEPAECKEDDDTPRFPVVPASYASAVAQQLEIDITSLEGLLEAPDLNALRKWAHRVSGGLSMLGPSSLMDTCEELRSAIRSSSQWSGEVEELARVMHDELKEFRSQNIAVED